MMRDKKCFEWAAGAVAYNSLSFDGVYPAIDISTPLNVTAGGTQDDSGREVAAGCCPTSEQDCLVGRRDLLDNGAAAGGFRSGFRFWSDPFPRCGHGRAFTYNYVKSHLKHAALHDLSASQSEAARSECVVHVKAASEANLQATNTRHGSNTLQNGTQYQTHNSSFITHNSEENVIGRFLSPDPYIQAPYFAQNFDRYSYVWNNPLKYVDPSGYLMVPIYRDHGLSGIGASRRQQNDKLDWIYGRGLYAIDGPAVSGLVLQWLVTTGGGGGMPQVSWITTSSSGMVISGNSEYNGTYVAVTTHNGQTGSWVQVSGAITYGVINGKVVAVVNAGARCVWVASGVNNGYTGNDINFTGSDWWNAGTGMNGLINGAAGSTYRAVSAASTEAQVMRMIGITSNTTKVIGIAGSITNVFVSGINAYNHRNSGDAGFYNSKLVGSAIIAATSFIPIVGPVLSIGLGAVDAAGGFDGIYHYTGSPVFQYQMIGYSSGIGW